MEVTNCRGGGLSLDPQHQRQEALTKVRHIFGHNQPNVPAVSNP